MKKIDFSNSGGFPLTGDKTLNGMQDAYLQILDFVNAYIGIPKVGNFIIQGCKLVGADLTEGWMYIDGEIVYFPAVIAPVDGINTKFKKVLDVESVAFKNGANYPVYSTAIIQQASDGLPLVDYITIGQKLAILAEGRVSIPTGYTTLIVQPVVFANINTSEYEVVGSIEQVSSTDIWNYVNWNVGNPTATGFSLILRGENFVGPEEMWFNFKIVKR